LNNQVVLAGRVVHVEDTRVTPAGLKITPFEIEHRSVQKEAGTERTIRCRVPVVLVGDQTLSASNLVVQGAELVIKGFLSQRSQTDTRLVLHAQAIRVYEQPSREPV
jgi:primosomal replication protein PriB